LENTKIISDDPFTSGILDFEKYSKFLADAIINSKPRFVVGIFGDWGTGKTTLMMMIKELLEKNKKILTVWFDAWRYEKEQHLAVIPLLRTVELALEDHIKRNDTKWEIIRNAIIRTATAFSQSNKANIEIAGIASAEINFKELTNSLKGDGSIGNDIDVIYYHATDFLNNALIQLRKNDTDYRIVIFIDDLDRCLPEKSLEVIESIKSFFDLEGIIYVLGMNSNSITSIIQQKYGNDPTITGFDILKKIVQLPFLIPEWNEGDMSKFIDEVIIKELQVSEDLVNATIQRTGLPVEGQL
jgi:predicted KAP-like P-loop ATPase